MTEQYPQDDALNLLSGLEDSQTGLPLPAIGESPYFTSFYRMADHINRLLAPANHLRVFKDGDLTFGVRPGPVQIGDDLIDFAGLDAQTLVNNAENSIYLTASGTTLTLHVSQTGLPAPSVTAHWPLAVISTGTASVQGQSGQYGHADIRDLRSLLWNRGPLN
jgi:hypothetical protein